MIPEVEAIQSVFEFICRKYTRFVRLITNGFLCGKRDYSQSITEFY